MQCHSLRCDLFKEVGLLACIKEGEDNIKASEYNNINALVIDLIISVDVSKGNSGSKYGSP